METSELLKKVRRIEIKTKGLSKNIFAGEYHSAFKGLGMTFAEVREYQYGDDIRSIDWNVTARFGHPYIKVFEEERELTVVLLIDVSGSRDFGSVSQMKRDIFTEVAATIAFSTIQNNDKIGVILFSFQIKLKSSFHLKRVVNMFCKLSGSLSTSSPKATKQISPLHCVILRMQLRKALPLLLFPTLSIPILKRK